MTFLEPLLLWGLPLALLPVIIHLFNRLRHRSIEWGAMMFLISATRKSTRYAKLRQWLILLFRALAIFVLVLAISRPLAGGWVGWMLHPAPDAIVLVLDRSASMEARIPGGNVSKRVEALRLFAEAAKGFQETSRFYLFDTALRTPQEIGDPTSLPQLSVAGPTDSAADIPATLQSVLDWVGRNRPGNFEIWLASDLQRSNWQPDSERWVALSAQLAGLPQGVRVRLLTLDQAPSSASWSLTINEVNRRLRTEPPEINLVLTVDRNNPNPEKLPISLAKDGASSQFDLEVTGQSFRHNRAVVVDSATGFGWGKLELPADDSPRDNSAYFVYAPPVPLKTIVVSADPAAARILQLAAAPFAGDTNRLAEVVTPDRAEAVAWSDYALVLWNAAPPKPAVAAKLRQLLDLGGSIALFAAGEPGSFEGLSFGESQTAAEKPWAIGQWKREEGLLGNTEEKLSLPVNELLIGRRQPVGGVPDALASFEDRSAFLLRKVVGKGEVVACATSPHAEWSNLRDGLVLVPMVQRLLQDGGRRFTQASMLAVGQAGPTGQGDTWISLDGIKDPRIHAGVYRAGNRLVAVNRPAAETDPEMIEGARARTLFGRVKVTVFAEQKQSEAEGRLQSELWRAFLFIMLLFLLAEAILILPPKPEAVTGPKFSGKGGAA